MRNQFISVRNNDDDKAMKIREEFSFVKGNYLILIVSLLLMDFAGEIPGTYYSDYIIQLGGSPTIIGLISLFSMLALASIQLPGGYLADKYGRRWLISTLTFGVALSYIFHATAPSWHFILIGETVKSLFHLYQPALDAMMADSLPPEKRGMGFSIINTILAVSTTPAPAIALLLVTIYGSLRGMRIAYAIVTILLLVVATFRLKLSESTEISERLNLKEALSSYPKALREGIDVWKVVPRSTLFLLISQLILQFSFGMIMNLFLVYAFYVLQIGGPPNPTLAPQQDPALQLARERWAYVSIALSVSTIILSIPTGKIIDKIGRKIPLVLSGTLMVPFILIFVYGNYLTLFVTMILAGFYMILAFSSYSALLSDLVPQALRGKVAGSINFFSSIFMAVGGMIGGVLYDNVSPQSPFFLMPILTILSILITLFYVHEPKPEERQT